MNEKPDLSKAREDFVAQRWDQAESICRRILSQDHDHLPALELLARIQSARGDFSNAIKTLEEAIRISPESSELYRHCGDLHFNAGEPKKAIHHYRHADSLCPNDPEIQNNLGVALRDSGSLDEATTIFEHIINTNPERALPYRNLGDVLRMRGNLDLAFEKYQAAEKIEPRNAATQNSLGIISSMRGKIDHAISCFRRAVEINPSFPEAENNLANALSSTRRFEEAVIHAQNAVRLRPRFANAHLTLGNIYKLQGKNDLAISEYRLAAEADPTNALVQQGLGSALTDAGHFTEAITHLENALHINPNLFVIYQNLMALAVEDQYKFSDQQLDRIQKLIASNQLPSADAARLHFAIGSLLDKRADYEGAVRHFQFANEMQKEHHASEKQFKSEGHILRVNKIIECFDRSILQGTSSGLASDRPVFIVGMPRSGTTLVEQIIASHPDAEGVGERSEVARISEKMASMAELPYPKCVHKVTSQQLANLAEQYENHVCELAGDARRTVDKMPDNFLYLGLIAMLFPKAHVIHCRRNPLDICLSCYRSDFGGVRWAWTLDDIGHYFVQYHRLMAHWKENLSLHIHDVRYENLISDHQREAEKLIAACGLPWSDACLDFHKGNRMVQTLSRVQVRQPIYRSSIDRWRNYENFLQPVHEMLQKKLGADFP